MIKKFLVFLLFILSIASVVYGHTQSDIKRNSLFHLKFKGVVENMVHDSQGHLYFILANFTRYVQKLICLFHNGSVKWSLEINNSGPLVGGPVLDREGNIYITTDPGVPIPFATPPPVVLFSIDKNGHIRWRYKLGHHSSGAVPIIDSNGIIFVNTGKEIYSIYQNGTLKNVYNPDVKMYGPRLTDDMLYLFTNKSVYAFTKDLKFLWKYNLSNTLKDIVADSSGNVYISMKNGELLALNEEGKLTWSKDYGVEVNVGIFNNYLICSKKAPTNTILYAISMKTGDNVWSIKIQGKTPLHFAAGSQNMYISTFDYENDTSYLYVLSNVGKIVNKTAIPGLVTSLIVMKEKNDIVYAGTDCGEIYQIEYKESNNQSVNDDSYQLIMITLTTVIILFVIVYIAIRRGKKNERKS